MADMGRLTPLAHRRRTAGDGRRAVSITEIADRAVIALRIRPDDSSSLAVAGELLGFELATAPRTSSGTDGCEALPVSVDQWFITAPIGRRDALVAALATGLGGRFAAVIDHSDAHGQIRLAGDGAVETVMKGSGAADELVRGGPGTVVRTQLAGIAALVHLRSVNPGVIELYVGRSVAEHAWGWLEAASRPGAAVRLFAIGPPPPV